MAIANFKTLQHAIPLDTFVIDFPMSTDAEASLLAKDLLGNIESDIKENELPIETSISFRYPSQSLGDMLQIKIAIDVAIDLDKLLLLIAYFLYIWKEKHSLSKIRLSHRKKSEDISSFSENKIAELLQSLFRE